MQKTSAEQINVENGDVVSQIELPVKIEKIFSLIARKKKIPKSIR